MSEDDTQICKEHMEGMIPVIRDLKGGMSLVWGMLILRYLQESQGHMCSKDEFAYGAQRRVKAERCELKNHQIWEIRCIKIVIIWVWGRRNRKYKLWWAEHKLKTLIKTIGEWGN